MADILLLDDDEDFVRLMTLQIEARGHQVRVARSGARATAMCQEKAPDAVLVDGLLPDTNGIVWLGKFRQSQPQTPVWFISAFRFAQEAKSHALLTKELGAKVLSKPVNAAVLLDELCAALPAAADEDLPHIDDAQLISDLEAEFSAELPEKLERLRLAVQEFTQRPSNDSYEAALLLVHKLHGSAGMYGMDALGERAGHLEKMLREAAPQGGHVKPELLVRTEAMLAVLQE
jgi:DNA-binding response OmpR family regulator